ncbi:transcription antitermination factor NusB [Brachybacterium endophyticum]|uniref:Transcription antitermination protein NusB n=1 Tax=Brachybacterium endophyticum TaxID=2182385 RepID=A0A2U2RJ76_9MICO|nr:transcription antitermination factor NusB [Brachybacterium endophyticum]
MTSRSRERVRAIDVAFEADARERDLLDVLAERRQRTAAQTALPERAVHLVETLAAHAEEIDEQLSTHSRDWPLHRMPAVDRAILRTGAAEILHDAPADGIGAVIGEYATIARELSTEDSPRFVNGLLQRLGELRDILG